MNKLKIFILIIVVLTAFTGFAQNNEIKTIFGNKEVKKGGYGAMSLALQPDMFGRHVYLTGFRGGWIIDHWMSFGIGGYTLTSTVKRDIGWSGNDPRSLSLYMTYGGFYFEPTLFPKLPVHVSFPVLLGGGAAIYIDETYFWDPEVGFSYRREDSDVFLVIEPGANFEINFIRNLRFGLGVHYRLIEDLKLYETESNALNGLNFSFTIKLGKF